MVEKRLYGANPNCTNIQFKYALFSGRISGVDSGGFKGLHEILNIRTMKNEPF